MGDGIIMMRGVVFSEVGCVLMASWEVGWELMVFATVDAVVVSGVVVSVEGVISCGVRMGVVIWSAGVSAVCGVKVGVMVWSAVGSTMSLVRTNRS